MAQQGPALRPLLLALLLAVAALTPAAASTRTATSTQGQWYWAADPDETTGQGGGRLSGLSGPALRTLGSYPLGHRLVLTYEGASVVGWQVHASRIVNQDVVPVAQLLCPPGSANGRLVDPLLGLTIAVGPCTAGYEFRPDYNLWSFQGSFDGKVVETPPGLPRTEVRIQGTGEFAGSG